MALLGWTGILQKRPDRCGFEAPVVRVRCIRDRLKLLIEIGRRFLCCDLQILPPTELGLLEIWAYARVTSSVSSLEV